MAKKSKRHVSKQVEAKQSEITPRATSRARVTTAEFNPDYTPIIGDLKRIGILAGSFFVILVVLSFFLR